MYLCQFGLNLAIGPEDQSRLFKKSNMKLVTLKIRSRSQNLIIQEGTIGSEDKVQTRLFHSYMTLVCLKI